MPAIATVGSFTTRQTTSYRSYDLGSRHHHDCRYGWRIGDHDLAVGKERHQAPATSPRGVEEEAALKAAERREHAVVVHRQARPTRLTRALACVVGQAESLAFPSRAREVRAQDAKEAGGRGGRLTTCIHKI
jgi:hypothetical protein